MAKTDIWKVVWTLGPDAAELALFGDANTTPKQFNGLAHRFKLDDEEDKPNEPKKI